MWNVSRASRDAMVYMVAHKGVYSKVRDWKDDGIRDMGFKNREKRDGERIKIL